MILPRLVAVLALGWSTAAVAAEPHGAPATTQAVPFSSGERFVEHGGRSIYVHVCAGCHMPDGKGAAGAGTYPSLAGDARLAVVGYPIAIILHGRNAMPALGDYFTDRQIADVVAYVRTHFGNRYTDAATVAEVKAAR